MGSVSHSEDVGRSMQQFVKGLPAQHMEPLWSRMSAMVPGLPGPAAKPHMWTYESARPQLRRAAELVSEDMAERRVLMLVNPNLESPYTTDTIYGGLQIVNPGETAPAHRHIAFACRFIIEGEGFTAVEGKKMPLARGDVVVTPSWHWHDHGNESSTPVVWLDALNLPLFRFAPVHFAEAYGEKRYPSEHCDPCEWRHPWVPVQASLDSQDIPHALHHYRTKAGGQLSTTLGVQAERVAAGSTTEVMHDSRSFIYHCYEGHGRTVVDPPNGQRVEFRWTSKDTFAVPAWSKITHVNESAHEPAYLVAAHDGPLLESLQLRRPQA